MGGGASQEQEADIPAPKPLREWTEEEIVRILKRFQSHDKDGNGTLEFTEISGLLRRTGQTVDELDKLNDDNKIDAKEFFCFGTPSVLTPRLWRCFASTPRSSGVTRPVDLHAFALCVKTCCQLM